MSGYCTRRGQPVAAGPFSQIPGRGRSSMRPMTVRFPASTSTGGKSCRVAPNGSQPRLTSTASPSSRTSGVSTCTPATLSWLMLSSRNWCSASYRPRSDHALEARRVRRQLRPVDRGSAGDEAARQHAFLVRAIELPGAERREQRDGDGRQDRRDRTGRESGSAGVQHRDILAHPDSRGGPMTGAKWLVLTHLFRDRPEPRLGHGAARA